MSAVFELDQDGYEKQIADARLSGFDANEEMDAGFSKGVLAGPAKGLMQGGAEAVGLLNEVVPKLMGTSMPAVSMDSQFQQDLQDTNRQTVREAVRFWTPGANELGVAGRVLNGLGRIVLPTLAGAGTPIVAAPTLALAEGQNLIDEGVDVETAQKMALAEGAIAYTGFKLPFLGKTLAAKIATGAGGNLLLGAGGTAVERDVLEAGGYDELAKSYDPLDPTSRAVDVLLGAMFGGLAHWQTRMPSSERAAVLTAANAKHFQQDTAPGIPADVNASVAHQQAMETALDQLDRGEPVSVNPKVFEQNFKPRPERAAPDEAVWRDVFGEDMPKAPAAPDVDTTPARPLEVTGEAAIRNPVTFDATPEVKLRELKALTAENVPVVQKVVDDLNARLAGTESKLNIKEDAKILEKAARPSILAKKPWHGVEHIRDSLRFKTVLDRLDQLPGIIDVLKDHGIGVEKIDTGKLLTPGEWGWRIVSLDLRMPNGQLVEHYMPVRELEVAKKGGGHQLFEKWRNEDIMKLSPAKQAEYFADLKKSRDLYQAAWESAAARTGLDDTAALASLKSFETSAGSLTSSKSLKSSPVTGTSVRQVPSSRTAETSGDKTTTSSGESRNLKADAVMMDSSGRIIPDDAFQAPVISAVKELLLQEDVLVPTGEVDADGNAIVRSGREVMAEAEAGIAKAEADAKGIEAAVNCFLTRGNDAS